MKKIIVLLSLFSTFDFAQDTLKNYNLGEIVVTSQQNNLVKSSSIIDIDLSSIENKDGNDITDALNSTPGMYITTTSKNESRIYMRGYDQRQVAVFLDGVPIYDSYSGLVDLSNLPKNSFKKITVSKGMPSLAYGANSMGGTINFITKDRLDKMASINVETGTVHSTSVGVNGNLGRLFYNINGGYSKSDGFNLAEFRDDFNNEDGGKRDNSDFENLGGMLKLGIEDFYNFDLAYSLMIVNNEKGVPTDVYTKRPRYWRYTAWNKSINNFMFSSVMNNNISIKGNFYYETYKNILNSYDDNSFATQEMNYAFQSTYDDHSYGVNLLGDFNVFNVGFSRFSFSWRKDVHKEEGNFNQGFSRYEASLLSAGLEQDLSFTQNLVGALGIGYDLLTPIFADQNNLRENSSSLNLFAGLSYKLSEEVKIHLNTSKKNRFPTLKEFYSETIGRDVANPDLDIEKSINSELGIKLKVRKNALLDANVFYSSINDLIQSVSLGEGLRQFQNVGKAELIGAEFGLQLKYSNFNVDVSYTYLSAKNISDDAISEHLEYRPEHVISFSPNYQFDFGTNLQAELFFIGNKYGIDADTREFIKMDSYLLANLKISHTIFENYIIYVRVNNITNVYYESEYGFPQPGRELYFGFKLAW
jgi:iron complex outermembrane receptor protein